MRPWLHLPLPPPSSPHRAVQACSDSLSARLAVQAPLRVQSSLLPGVPDAPLSQGVVACLSVAHVPALLAWNVEHTLQALETFKQAAMEQLTSEGVHAARCMCPFILAQVVMGGQ